MVSKFSLVDFTKFWFGYVLGSVIILKFRMCVCVGMFYEILS
jgi:hypothetical protein